ncbi:GntR family carbon starvation induced transcriptional regulator [Bradyrhizobium sp. GM24.11]
MKPVVPSETLATAAYQKLRAEVIGGIFPFGRKLKIGALCERYGVSAAPMREALNRAAKDGLVQQSDQRGFSVAPLSVEDLDDLLQTRLVLNEYALRKSFEFGGHEWEEQVMLAWMRLDRIPYNPVSTEAAWERAHRLFHASLLSACGAPRVIAYCDQLFDSNDRYRFMARTSRTRAPRRNDHKLITDAVIARRPDDAVALLSEHFTETANRCREQLMLEGRAQPPARSRS